MSRPAFPDQLTPSEVLAQVAAALPDEVRGNVIIIGSLAAGYNFFSGDGAASIRTKDVDALFSPHAKAVAAAVEVTERLLAADWKQKEDARFGVAGRPDDNLDALPMVRLKPPEGENTPAQWFLELLSAPPEYEAGGPGKKLQRLHTSAGDFAICSFDYLALTEWKPLPTAHGVLIARPEMMALANMLHHPAISDTLIADTDYKRANKDLGRVLALAHLTTARDRRDGQDELGQWATRMWDALREKFGDHARELALRAGSGIDALLASPTDLAQALRIANIGLLASLDIGLASFEATGRRFQEEVLAGFGTAP
jgi:hypothetical protein